MLLPGHPSFLYLIYLKYLVLQISGLSCQFIVVAFTKVAFIPNSFAPEVRLLSPWLFSEDLPPLFVHETW